MNGDNRDSKKGFSSSVALFLLGAVGLVFMLQYFLNHKVAKVSFSYQLESLVNLQLLQSEENRKVALNDHLVTFSGRFRERIGEESRKRYAFLQLLDVHNEQLEAKKDAEHTLEVLRGKIVEASRWLLYLLSIDLPKEGFVVIDDVYNTLDRDNSVVIHQLPTKQLPNLADLLKRLKTLKNDSAPATLEEFSGDLLLLVRYLRSPSVGIGSTAMKSRLADDESKLMQLEQNGFATGQPLSIYTFILQDLQRLSQELTQEHEHVRFTELRSVRSYQQQLAEFTQLQRESEETALRLTKAQEPVEDVVWFFNDQELSTKILLKQEPEKYHNWFLVAKAEWERFPENRSGYFRAPGQPVNKVLEKKFKSEEQSQNYSNYIFSMMPLFLIIFLLYFLFSKQMKGMGANAMNFGKSPAKLLAKGSHKVTFKDVAGVDEALEELQEIVEFLRSPEKFTALGGKIPKGVLLIGSPGTGKTLIAKAVAGEADRPFFSISGSDFVEMFVGVGASRIRDMFDQAKKNAPCIIFMDEIDAVGRHRGAGIGGGHDEREQTLNQLLVEMDGFSTNESVILMAATNRPDVLDRALLRPGRFDRRVVINLPDIKGRFEILKVHARNIKLDPSVDLMDIARSTPGSSGADLMNLLNESALLAARRERTAVTKQEVNEARDKILYGKERRSLELDENEKWTTAYHESGHALVGLLVKNADPVDKVTIIPRGFSLGATMFLPKKNRVNYWKTELHDRLAVLMGGRAAEEIFVKDVSSGAQQDFEMATNLARSMVCEWGMSEELGLVAYEERSDSGKYLGVANYQQQRYSQATAQMIDHQVKTILETAHETALRMIQEHKKEVQLMADMLMVFETLEKRDIEEILHGEWNEEEKRKRLKSLEELYRRAPTALETKTEGEKVPSLVEVGAPSGNGEEK